MHPATPFVLVVIVIIGWQGLSLWALSSRLHEMRLELNREKENGEQLQHMMDLLAEYEGFSDYLATLVQPGARYVRTNMSDTHLTAYTVGKREAVVEEVRGAGLLFKPMETGEVRSNTPVIPYSILRFRASYQKTA